MSDNKPAHTIRLGRIKATIWSNVVDGRTFYDTTIRRTYKTGDAFEETDRFGRDDLLLAAKAADLANTWIHEQGSKDAGSSGEGDE